MLLLSRPQYIYPLRSADLLAEQKGAYRPNSTLLGSHVTWRHETLNQQEISYLVVSVPEPKELAEKQSSVLVELLPTNSFICPVTAYKKFSQLTQPDPDKPLFSDKKSFLTSAEVNSCLKTLLKDVVNYSKEQVLGHSFRAGVISGGNYTKETHATISLP
mgnify:FL=1